MIAREDVVECADEIWDAYWDYVKNVSHPQHAISLPTAALFMHLMDVRRPHSVLDLGSGFTSFVSRFWMHSRQYEACCVSVDTDPMWLAKTADFTYRYGVTSGELILDTELHRTERFDVIIHDLANGEVRNEWAPIATSMLAPGGVIIFDDMQHHGHHMAASEAARQAGLDLHDVYDLTLDEFGRYAAVAR
jgi:predicted O-methyltransferase YrrM